MLNIIQDMQTNERFFNYNWCLTDLSKTPETTYKHITTVHDSALTYDKSAVLIWAWNPTLKKVVVLEEHWINKTWYYEDQANQLKEIISDSVKYTVPQNVDMQNKPIREPHKSDTFFYLWLKPEGYTWVVSDGLN